MFLAKARIVLVPVDIEQAKIARQAFKSLFTIFFPSLIIRR